MKFLASIFLALAIRCDRKRFAEEAARKERIEKGFAALVLEHFNDENDPRFQAAPEWGPDDAALLETFLKTETGNRLRRRFAAVAGTVAIAGCADSIHTAHSAGNGNGWNEAYQWFVKLSRVAGVQATPKDEQLPEDEEALLERFSS